jgi:hypothetical protein
MSDIAKYNQNINIPNERSPCGLKSVHQATADDVIYLLVDC